MMSVHPDPGAAAPGQDEREPRVDEVGFELPTPPRIGRSRIVIAGAVAVAVAGRHRG